MFCIHCGKEISDEATFCTHCGERCSQETETSKAEIPHQQTFQNACPSCGGNNCTPHIKTNVQTNGSNYSCCTGALGFGACGPFGLLMGLCGKGKNVNMTQQTVWLCSSCGKEFLSKQDARAAADRSLKSTPALIALFAICSTVFALVAVDGLSFLWTSNTMFLLESTIAAMAFTAALIWWFFSNTIKRDNMEFGQQPAEVLFVEYDNEWDVKRVQALTQSIIAAVVVHAIIFILLLLVIG